jgi:peroxiredoxin Q/BCP
VINVLKEGDNAPEFRLPDQNGKIHSLADYSGKNIVLYFYPKDMTPGCTVEACSFRDNFSEFTKKGIIVLGVSNDSEESHKNFASKYKLPFTLLSDKSRELGKKFGVYGEKNFLGKLVEGLSRVTFLIDENGVIRKVYPKVDVNAHAKEIIADVE